MIEVPFHKVTRKIRWSWFEGIEICPMTQEDVANVSEIEGLTFTHAWGVRSFRKEIENPHSIALVARKRTTLAGYVVAWLTEDEAEIGTFAVHPRFRNLGVGQSLMRYLLAELAQRDVTAIHLEVRKSNLPARKLYEKFGFEIQGVRKNYYAKEQEDALLMTLTSVEGLDYGLV